VHEIHWAALKGAQSESKQNQAVEGKLRGTPANWE
jgi:hypothetical protein